MTIKSPKSHEHARLENHRARRSNWKLWGPYLSDRSWGTVREDYSENGEAWDYLTHDESRSCAYRWGEDGIAGISDRNQYLCFGMTFWNGKDSILKERLFGLTGKEGNHGEDVKELYYYLDSTPTHSYMKMLYKYPQAAFPYRKLVEENSKRSREVPEYELIDTGVLHEDRYFDCEIEYAKAGETDLLIQVTVKNNGPEASILHLLPTLWFRNTWSWGYPSGPLNDTPVKPSLTLVDDGLDKMAIRAFHSNLGEYTLHAEGEPQALFTENETNVTKISEACKGVTYFKDAFHSAIVDNDPLAVNPAQKGTKACFHYEIILQPGESRKFRFRLTNPELSEPFEDFSELFSAREDEANAFYNIIQKPSLTAEDKAVQRQALAGMLWSKQLYYYDMEQWMQGDPARPAPKSRLNGRNAGWDHLTNFDIISMPDKWEFPWYAAWDLAFHAVAFALVDADFAKRQIVLMTREWYMHPNGQLPAYEWAFSDVNPPVHAWAAWRVYKIDAKESGHKDRDFLEGVFHKLLMNFTWWVNRKDVDGNNIFQGGFLGLDNIGVFDRSAPIPEGGHIDQADGTAWMASYSLHMMTMALELAEENPVYQDLASKFLEHFLRVAHAMTDIGGNSASLWNEEDGFFYDLLRQKDGAATPLRVRSLVGLLPLMAVQTIGQETLRKFPDFYRRLLWFTTNRPHLAGNMACFDLPGSEDRRLVALLTKERLIRILARMFDEQEFLSPHGIRSLSKYHDTHPYHFTLSSETYTVSYDPSESTSPMFGGNSNWRGPVWFPINYLFIEALQRFHHYYGPEFKVEYPTGSGDWKNLQEIARDIADRLIGIFRSDTKGRRPFHGDVPQFQESEHFRGLWLFNEYFDGDNGRGLGASHQTGWTGLVAKLIQQIGGV